MFLSYFLEAISFIEKAHAERASVLVHCWAGISRSVTVCLAYLMYALHNTLEEAFDLLLKQNGAIAPNFHFLETLTCWERQLFESSDSASSSSVCSSSVPSSAVSIASSEASPISKEFIVTHDTNRDISASRCCYNKNNYCSQCQLYQNLHVPCHKTASSPIISMNLPYASSSSSTLSSYSTSFKVSNDFVLVNNCHNNTDYDKKIEKSAQNNNVIKVKGIEQLK